MTVPLTVIAPHIGAVLDWLQLTGFTTPDSPESPRYYDPSPYGVVRPHHLGVFVTLRAGVISLPER